LVQILAFGPSNFLRAQGPRLTGYDAATIKVKLYGSIRIRMLDGTIKPQNLHRHAELFIQFAFHTVLIPLSRFTFPPGEFPVTAERR
jgi:hypothetical protein